MADAMAIVTLIAAGIAAVGTGVQAVTGYRGALRASDASTVAGLLTMAQSTDGTVRRGAREALLAMAATGDLTTAQVEAIRALFAVEISGPAKALTDAPGRSLVVATDPDVWRKLGAPSSDADDDLPVSRRQVESARLIMELDRVTRRSVDEITGRIAALD